MIAALPNCFPALICVTMLLCFGPQSHLPFGPTAYFTLSNTVLRHDIADCKPASQANPHLILDGMTSKVGLRVKRILQSLYPIPKDDAHRVITFANSDDFVSFRHHTYSKEQGKVVLQEAGPRFEMQPYEVKSYPALPKEIYPSCLSVCLSVCLSDYPMFLRAYTCAA
jgi:hypothetical protein